MKIKRALDSKQYDIALALLLRATLASLDGFKFWNTSRLSAYIHALKKTYNIPILSTWKSRHTRDGRKVRYVEYSLPRDVRVELLKLWMD